MSGYYGKAIRGHPGDLDAMRNAVFATFFHAESTDEDPHHSRCPVGSNSRCFYQRALAAAEEPGSHRDNLGTPLTRDVSRHVEEVYVRLGHPDLLRRCLKGATQNANESLHSKVWAKCPKTGFRWLSACRGSNLCSDRRVQPGGRVYGGAHIRHHGHYFCRHIHLRVASG